MEDIDNRISDVLLPEPRPANSQSSNESEISDTQTICELQTDTLLRALQCKLCDSRFIKPKELDCGHVFCQECLREYVDCANNSNVTCPFCTKSVTIPTMGVASLPAHIFYQEIAREVRVLDNDKLSRGSCKFCSDSDKHLATVKCVTCQVAMCGDCSANHVHNGVNNVVVIHRKQDSILCDILPKRDTACSVHPTESLLLFCTTCQECLCFKCKDEKHSNHIVADLSDTAGSAKNTISDVQHKLKDYIKETREALSDIERISKEYEAKVDATKNHIESQVELLINHIIKEKERMLDELSSHAKDIQTRLDRSRNDMQSKDLRASAMAELADNLLSYGNDAENTLYKSKLEHRWNDMQEEKLNRFGQGYKMNVQFYMNEGLLAMLSKELGTFMVTQNLSPWTSRRSKPFDISPMDRGNLDPSIIQQRLKTAMSNDFSMKRSPIFAKFVDPKWTMETYKTSKSSGQTVTVWMKTDEEQEQMSRASKRISMRSVSTPCLTAEMESFNELGEHEYKKTFEKLPDGTICRLAIAAKNTIMLAVYPGVYASSVIGQSKLRSLSKKDTDGVFVAVLERGNFVCGELRKIPIPDGACFDFDLTGRGIIVVKPLSTPNLKLYDTRCSEITTDHEAYEQTVLKIMESPDHDIVAVVKEKDGSIFCEKIADDGERTPMFKFPVEMLSPMNCLFREARFDRYGNVLMHFKTSGSADVLYQVTETVYRKEYLVKPEMLHRVDNMAVLPDGRLCVFDKVECVLMTLRYL